MAASKEAIRALGALATAQWGLLTAAQARRMGVTVQQLARLSNDGALERVRHGVYRVAGSPSHQFEQLRAAWLALDPERLADERLAEDVAVVSHRTAAAVHGLGDLEVDVLEFTVRDRRQSRDRQLRFHRGQLEESEWTLVNGLPVTTILTTIRDLAAARVDGGHLAGVVRDAVTTHHVDLDAVSDVLADHAHLYGAPLADGATLLQRFLEQAGVPASTSAVAALVDRSATTVPAALLAELYRPGGLFSDETRRAIAAMSAQMPSNREIAKLAAAAPAAGFAEQARRLFEASAAPRRARSGKTSRRREDAPPASDDQVPASGS